MAYFLKAKKVHIFCVLIELLLRCKFRLLLNIFLSSQNENTKKNTSFDIFFDNFDNWKRGLKDVSYDLGPTFRSQDRLKVSSYFLHISLYARRVRWLSNSSLILSLLK